MLRAEGPFENDPGGGFWFRMETHHFAMMAISKINRDTIRSTRKLSMYQRAERSSRGVWSMIALFYCEGEQTLFRGEFGALCLSLDAFSRYAAILCVLSCSRAGVWKRLRSIFINTTLYLRCVLNGWDQEFCMILLVGIVVHRSSLWCCEQHCY